MIRGIGTDMVEISRMEALLARHGESAARRILAPSEMPDFLASRDQARFLAKRFAVKEAFSKAVGTGLRAPVLLTSIGLTHDALGKPEFDLAPALLGFLDARAIARHHVSLSDERHHVLAFVVLEGDNAPMTEENSQ
jgi:holo-[acyl-carrier protein] synthase